MSELNKKIKTLVDAINTKSNKHKSCAKLAKLFYDKKDEIDVDITNKTIQEISPSYRIVFIKDWCLIYVNDGEIDYAKGLVKKYVNNKNILGDHYLAQGKIFYAIAADLPEKCNLLFPSIIAETLTIVNKCENKEETYTVVRNISFLFRKKNIEQDQIMMVLSYINDISIKDWTIWALLGQGFPHNNYLLRYKMIHQYSEDNEEVLFQDLDIIIENIKNDEKIIGEKKNELLQEIFAVTQKSYYSEGLKERILKIILKKLKK